MFRLYRLVGKLHFSSKEVEKSTRYRNRRQQARHYSTKDEKQSSPVRQLIGNIRTIWEPNSFS